MSTDVENLTYGVLVGRYTRIVVDPFGNPDEDGEPLIGNITITCDAKQVVVYTPDDVGSGGYTDVTPAPVVLTLDPDGYLTYNGIAGISLLATDGTQTNPTDFTYTATFNLFTQDGETLPRTTQTFQLPGGTVQSLPGLVPVSASGGVLTVQGPPGDGLQIDGSADTFADLPSPTGLTGQIYVTQDTGGAYRSSGTAWQFLAVIRGPQGLVGVTPVIQVTVDPLAPGDAPTATISGDPASPLLTLGLPPGQDGAASDLAIDDTTTNAGTLWSSQKTSQAISDANGQAIQYTNDALAQAGITPATGQIVYRLQNADGTYPLRGAVAAGAIVIWLGTAFPTAGSGYSQPGTDGYMYWDPNA